MDSSRGALAFEFAQAAVVDSGSSTAYLMAPDARIDAVDLSSGQLLASSTKGAKPLLLYHDVLLAQAEPHEPSEGLRLIGLTAKDLAVTYDADIPLPAGVPALIDDRLGSYFHVSAYIDSGEIVVQWRSAQRRITATPTIEPARVVTGWARIDPNDGRLTRSGSGEAPVRGSVEGDMPEIVRHLIDSGALARPVCRVDDLVAAIGQREDEGATKITLLHRYDTAGMALPDVELFGSELTFRSFSADCRYLLASKAVNGWLWSIYSTTTGSRVAQLHMPVPASQFFIWRNVLVYESSASIIRINGQLTVDQPRRLLTRDLGTGGELGSWAIRETTYLGPYPSGSPNMPAK